MSRISPFASALGLAVLGARSVLADCVSFGMDFQNGKTYFQNVNSHDNFTFVSEYEGCQPDTAYNILVDPVGDQLLCSDTQLTPDNTDQLSNCPIMKSSLYSGNWSVIVISNNGNSGEPIAYERDFTLTVGSQITSTYIPTVTATVVSTPVVNTTSTTTSTLLTTLAAKTVTSPSATFTPTTTLTPARVTTTSTKYLLTVKQTSYTINVNPIMTTATATCILPTKPARFDPRARIRPTVGPLAPLFADGNSLGSLFSRDSEEEKERFVEERAARLALAERAPDPQPLIVTDLDTAHWTTSTSTSTAATVTATMTSEATTTATVTPSPVTVLTGKTTAARVTITAATPTKVVTRYAIATTTVTKSINAAYTITVTTTPASVKAACTSAGGVIY